MREGSAQPLSDAATDHRRRILAAMVEAASEHGYAAATVARVVARAGISRATFYEHFHDRDECFSAAYRTHLEEVRTEVRAAADEATAENLTDDVLKVLLSELAACPTVGRLILIEALAAAGGIREEHEGLVLRLDCEIGRFLDAQGTATPIQIPATALLGGVGEVLATLTLTNEHEPVEGLHKQLTQWIDSYRLPEGSSPLPQSRWSELGQFARIIRKKVTDSPELLPRGRSALPGESAASRRRGRLLEATARLTAEEGYMSLTVARIASAARVPRSAFYSHFEGKEAALMAAQTESMQGAMAAVAAEYALRAPWPERVWRSLVAFLGYVAENPVYARVDFVESYAAGRAVTEHRQRNRMVFALFLEEGYQYSELGKALPRFCSEAIGAAIYALMRKLVIEDRIEQMLTLAPAAAYTILAPFLGPQEAASQVLAWSREAY